MGSVLLIVSTADSLELSNGASAAVGTYLNETAIPVLALLRAGYEVRLATPTGRRPVLDRHSLDVAHFEGDEQGFRDALEFWETGDVMSQPRSFARILAEGLDRHAAVFVPGGHAPISDLTENTELGTILRHFHAHAKPTALLCHGPVAILSSLPRPGAFIAAMKRGDRGAAAEAASGWQYAGYRMTTFSNAEEQVAEDALLHGRLTYYVRDALALAGGEVTAGATPFAPHVVVDRELITGQNPRSDRGLAEALVTMLRRRPAAHGN